MNNLIKKIDSFFINHDPHILLKLFLPYHLLLSLGKIFWMILHLIKNDAHLLEYNPKTQWKFHLKMTWFWVANFPFVSLLYFGFPKLWIGLGLLMNTYYSLYANFDTEFGAIPASYAAMMSDQIASKQKDK